MKRRRQSPVHETLFRNLSEKNLNIDDVFERISRFMREEPRAAYQLIIGTDAQVHAGHTKFVTSVVIYRPGRGAWFCYRQTIVPREIRSLQEKLSLETTLSQELAALVDGDRRGMLEDILLPYVYQGAELQVFVDIDAGTDAKRNKTSAYVADMVGRVEAMGLTARVKPEAIGASAVANRFTKTPYRGGGSLSAAAAGTLRR
ncbi:ribonuclease H-like YkuK family protein [Cohnella soli]|uniref:Ribonuclease H-like YkuK family protein n=1 Tax=Cohnella soli TaxID=425005 RepID=A0ABW0HUZ7_9BACL